MKLVPAALNRLDTPSTQDIPWRRIKGESMISPLPLGWRIEPTPEVLSTGILNCPRGRITEIFGPRSSGRTSLLHSILAASTGLDEFAVLVDASGSFDPCSAAGAGVELAKLIWIRCGGNVDHALRAADLVIQAGGFGVIALDLAEASPAALARIPPTAWFRFRRAIESTPTILAVVSSRPLAKSCSALLVETKRRGALFTGKYPFELLRGAEYELAPRKPVGQQHELWVASA